MDENTRNKSAEDDEFTEKQAKIIVVILSLFFIAAMVTIIVVLDRKNARYIEEEARLESELEEANERREELLEDADTLFMEKVKNNTEGGIVQLDSIFYSLGYTATETGWVDDGGRLNFDFSDSDAPKVLYYPSNSEDSYYRKLTTVGAIDDYKCKLGAREFILSHEDMVAFGRIVVGETSGFTKEE